MEYSGIIEPKEATSGSRTTVRERAAQIRNNLTDAITVLNGIDSVLTGAMPKEQDKAANPSCLLHELEIIVEQTDQVLALVHKITNTLA